MLKKFIAVIVRDDNQWIGWIDEIGVRSQGKTLVELVANLKDTAELTLNTYGEKPPIDKPTRLDEPIDMHGALSKEIEIEVPELTHLEERHFTEPEPIKCKWCGSLDVMKYGSRKGVQEYICQKCGRKFIDLDAPYKKHSTVEEIGTSISSYYDGLSFADVARHLTESGNPTRDSTVYRWVMSYTQKAINVFEAYHPQVSDVWVADETTVKFDKELYWIWDIIDHDTRFLLATYLSPNRGTKEAQILMETASKRARKAPKKIVTDKLAGYLDGIELTFGADTKHVQSSPFEIDNDNNIIERMQGTIRERTKVVRGFKSFDTASLIIEGFRIHYNFFKPHLTLKELPPKGIDKTPAQVAKITTPFKTWTDFVRNDR